MTYRDKKNAERKNAAATHSHHKSFGSARAYRDYRNREIADHAVTTFIGGRPESFFDECTAAAGGAK